MTVLLEGLVDSRGSAFGSEPRKGLEEFRHTRTSGREETKKPSCETEPDSKEKGRIENGFSWQALW